MGEAEYSISAHRLGDRIRARALELGFDVVGVAQARRARRGDALKDWLARGYAADMAWLARDPDRRADPRQVLPGARSVVTVGLSYATETPPASIWDDPGRGRIARYAWGRDYHRVLTPMLRSLAETIREEGGPGAEARYYVDTGPVLEREVAAEGGLGFIGKNTLLIHPRRGSYLVLGEVLTTLPLPPDPSPAGGTCGACVRCLTTCPTHAFPAAYVLDSRRCISYLTIEHRGPIPVALRPALGNWIFGCDACQSVCPWVKRYSRPVRRPFTTFDPDHSAPRLLDLIGLDEAAFRERFRGTPVLRAKRRGLLRNVAVALGNWGDATAGAALETACRDPDPLIREHARWALDQVE